MEPIVFVKTNSIYMIAEDMVRELQNLNRLQVVAYKDVGTLPADYMHGNHEKNHFVWKSWYDFARTAQSVLRLFMLEASEMKTLFDPNFSQPGMNRNRESMKILNKPDNINESIEMAQGCEKRAKRYASDFDRLYPHYVTENKLVGIGVGDTKSLPGLMYVVDFPNRLVYQIVANMDVKYVMDVIMENDKKPSMLIHASLHVAAFKCTIGILENIPDEQLCRYNLMLELIKEYDPNQRVNDIGALTGQIGNLNVHEGENTEGSEDGDVISREVAEYFNAS